MKPIFKMRNASPEDTGLILQMIRELADFEKLLDQVIADEKTLSFSKETELRPCGLVGA